MDARRRARRALLPMLAAGFAALAPEGARAADCLAPIAANDKWTCTEELSDAETISYCISVEGVSGAGANRSFRIRAPLFPPRFCTCGAKRKGASARFNAASSYHCLDASRDLAESGTITRRRITGLIFLASQNSRRAVSCRPDPACVVPQ
jgi:hypothetical protein